MGLVRGLGIRRTDLPHVRVLEEGGRGIMAGFKTRKQVLCSTSISQVVKDVLPVEVFQVRLLLLPIGVVVAVIKVADRFCGNGIEIALTESIESRIDRRCRIPQKRGGDGNLHRELSDVAYVENYETQMSWLHSC